MDGWRAEGSAEELGDEYEFVESFHGAGRYAASRIVVEESLEVVPETSSSVDVCHDSTSRPKEDKDVPCLAVEYIWLNRALDALIFAGVDPAGPRRSEVAI